MSKALDPGLFTVMPSESFRDIPELFESSLEESLKARTKAISKCFNGESIYLIELRYI